VWGAFYQGWKKLYFVDSRHVQPSQKNKYQLKADSLFCARIERNNLKISLIIIKANLYPQSTICVSKEVSHGMG